MLIVRIDGGLGNQMFVYTFAKYLELKGYEVGIDASFYQDNRNVEPYTQGEAKNTIRNFEIENYKLSLPIFHNFNAEYFFATNDKFFFLRQKINKLLPRPFRRADYKYSIPDDLRLVEKMQQEYPYFPNHSYFCGFFQSLSYVHAMTPNIFKDFTFISTLSKNSQDVKNKIKNAKNSVFLHIRRGDYLLFVDKGYISLTASYYNNALKILLDKLESIHVFVFSNDIAWCKENLLCNLDKDVQEKSCFDFIDHNNEGNAVQDLELMRSCKHAVIANSTFSWWGAYLIDNKEKIVIAPAKVFSHSSKERMADFYPKNWILLNEE